MDKPELLKRFQSPDDKLLFSKVLDRLFLCQSRHEKTFSFFMDPIHAIKFTEIIQTDTDEQILAFGGGPNCERKMLGFAPSRQELTAEDFPIERISIQFLKKYGLKLSHRDFLGAITGLGINREKIGDINVCDGRAEAFVNRDVSGFICTNLVYAGRVKVTAGIEQTQKAFWEDWRELKTEDGREMDITVNSPRLDGIISAAFGVSRADSAKLVSGGKVSVNWTPVKQNEKVIAEFDTVTVRGHGRLRVDSIEYNLKKERYTVHLYING